MKYIFIFLFFSISSFTSEKITIKRYQIVYPFTNIKNQYICINEVYFDHQNKTYHTNIFLENNKYSIEHWTNTTTITINHKPKLQTKKNSLPYYNYDKKEFSTSYYNNKSLWKRRGNYRYSTLKNTYIPNNNTPLQQKNYRTIENGLWYDHFTDTYFTNVKYLSIDHIVPISHAFYSQKEEWTENDIKYFINSEHRTALLPILASENQIKGNRPPAYYLPPNTNFQPVYQDMWIRTKQLYNLHINHKELASL